MPAPGTPPRGRPLPGRVSALPALLAVGAALIVCPQPASAAFTPSAEVAGAASTRLSDWRTRSLWAYPVSAAAVRAAPSASAHVLGRLRFLTGDQQAELYVALAATRLASGQNWTQVSLPGRPNGLSGWVPSSALGSLHAVRGFLLIDRGRLRATLYRDGRALFSAPVGVGASATVTPAGRFYVLERLITWGDPAYGPYAIGTSAYAPTLSEWPGGGVVGIHGTNEPQLIPGRPSHGCVRMRDEDISRLWRLIALGTPIEIV